MIKRVSIFFNLKQQKHAKPVVSHVSTASVYLYTHRHVHTYTYTYTLVMLSAEIVIFERCVLRQNQSIHFELLDSYRTRLFGMVNEWADVIKDGNV